MQPNGNVIVIEAEPINECPTCGQPRVLRDHVIRRLLDLPTVIHPTRLHVRLPCYRCTNKRCLQKIFRTGLACAPDNPKTTNKVTHWILQHLDLSRCPRRDLQRQALPQRGSRSSVLMSITGRTTDTHDATETSSAPPGFLTLSQKEALTRLRTWLNNHSEVP
ncbi:transposase [Corynebacterium diphtheriae]|nr:transposase [Corynebacterium diphtheriae]CAB0734084.1 transposase [Corynebacterium diphtheriae]CAB0734180.1 transposase [Corynebacterium diphtheriae]CAB0785136.1 transposase [Corynebacterium diphtheriae]CAB0830972.1 transposase [Corynebacterium diphtheriae]